MELQGKGVPFFFFFPIFKKILKKKSKDEQVVGHPVGNNFL